MKKIILMAITLFTCRAFSGDPECIEQVGQAEVKEQVVIGAETPAYLRGATITVTLANGKTTTVPAEKFKMVPRKQQVVVTKTETVKTVLCNLTPKEKSKNRVSLIGGIGPTGGLKTSSPSSYTERVDLERGAVVGVQYQRLLTDKWSVGAQIQTNKTLSVSIGLDF